MAKILQPDIVARLDPNDKWNKVMNYGFKWHLFYEDKETKRPLKTICGIIFGVFEIEKKELSEVKAKSLCAVCFKGLEIIDD